MPSSHALHSYEPMLKESAQHFLSELQKCHPDLSGMSSVFARLIQTMHDPPLEIVWFYSAVTYRSRASFAEETLTGVFPVNDLFRLLVSCSASCCGVKRIAVLAPVILKLSELANREFFLWPRTEIDRFVEGVFSYICICCCRDLENNRGLSPSTLCFSESILAWTVDPSAEEWDFREALKAFYPLVGNGALQRIGLGCEVGYLAGAVMVEALMLGLCLKLGCGGSTVELHEDMVNWAVNSINMFRSWYFLDIMFRTLLDTNFPVTSLLDLGNEILARRVLYDAIITVDYSFLDPRNGGIQITLDDLKELALSWLFVAEEAVQFMRRHGDQSKAIAYADAFHGSWLCCQLVEWVCSQTGMVDKNIKTVASTPCGLIRLILILDFQRVGSFCHSFSKLHNRVVAYRSKVMEELGISKPESKKEDAIEMVSRTGVRRKREGDLIEGEIQAKFVRCHFEGMPMGDGPLSPCNAGEENMEAMEV